jgi:hypothetical protein
MGEERLTKLVLMYIHKNVNIDSIKITQMI